MRVCVKDREREEGGGGRKGVTVVRKGMVFCAFVFVCLCVCQLVCL